MVISGGFLVREPHTGGPGHPIDGPVHCNRPELRAQIARGFPTAEGHSGAVNLFDRDPVTRKRNRAIGEIYDDALVGDGLGLRISICGRARSVARASLRTTFAQTLQGIFPATRPLIQLSNHDTRPR